MVNLEYKCFKNSGIIHASHNLFKTEDSTSAPNFIRIECTKTRCVCSAPPPYLCCAASFAFSSFCMRQAITTNAVHAPQSARQTPGESPLQPSSSLFPPFRFVLFPTRYARYRAMLRTFTRLPPPAASTRPPPACVHRRARHAHDARSQRFIHALAILSDQRFFRGFILKFIGLEQHFFQRKYPLFKLANATRQRCLPRFLSAGRTTGVSFIFSTTLNTDALISIVITTLIVIQAVYHHFHSTIHHLFHFVIRLAMDVFYHGNGRSSTVW